MNTKPKVLVVDDNDAVREIVALVLDQQGFDTVAAEDGAKALRLATAMEFQVVVCDSIMPGLTGAEVVARLRAQPATAHVPIILSSGRADRFADANESDHRTFFLPKPFTPGELISAVQAAAACAA